MCQYSASEGFFNDWHLQNAAQFAVGGAGLVILEATAVSSNGRITPHCTGLWADEHIPSLERIATFVRSQGAACGLQIAHAGRKSSTPSPFAGIPRAGLSVADGGWPDTVVGASPIPWDERWITPHELTKQEIQDITRDFVAAANRAERAGINMIEIHAAHGYLISSFLSPLSNQRTDEYGGDFDNRTRLCVEVTKAVRQAWPGQKPLSIRLSCTEWVQGGWTIDDTVALAKRLAPYVDFIDCSSGGPMFLHVHRLSVSNHQEEKRL